MHDPAQPSDPSERPVRCAVVGCGGRARDYHVPLVARLPGLELVACASRRLESARVLAEPHGAAAFDDLDRMLEVTAPDLVVLAVSYHENGRMGLELARRGVSFLAETPVAHQLADGDEIVRLAARHGLMVAVAEQLPHFPLEALKRAVVESGAFGRVIHVASDMAAHGYHGTALIRHVIGFDVRPVQALGIQRHASVAPHFSRIEGGERRSPERWDFGTLEFEDGAFASFLFTNHGYDSPLRWHRQTRLFAERGMAVDGDLALLSEDGRERWPLEVRWRTREHERGHEVLALSVELPSWAEGGGRTITWTSPCPGLGLRDDELAVARCLLDAAAAIRGGRRPRYDAAQGLLDQECTLAMERSHERGGAPCPFPLER